MALLGFVGVVLQLVVVQAALTGLRRVDGAYDDVGRIGQAQRYFQDADQAHDALRADVVQAVLSGPDAAALPADVRDRVDADVAAYRENLRLVQTVPLSEALRAALLRLQPLQDRYASTAMELVHLAPVDQAAAQRALPAFTDDFRLLERGQGDVTAQLAARASSVKEQASRDERSARWRIVSASLVALAGLLLLSLMLNRLGRALMGMADRERSAAETLQHSLLPDALPDLPGLALAARYLPGGEGSQVGGDWYDVIPLPTGAVGLVMGDVAGHDLRAATVMGQIRNALRAYASDGHSPAEVLDRLNHLCLTQAENEMATCVYAVLEPQAGTLDVANAGHYAPLLVDAVGNVRSLEQPVALPLGAVRGTRYTSVRHHMPGASTLVLFTDGLVERRGVPVEQGLAAMTELLRTPTHDLGALCDRLLHGLLHGKPPADDVALLAVQASARLGQSLELSLPADPTCLVELRRTLERWLIEAGADDTEVYEVVVACSEAATNSVEHAYGPGAARFDVSCDLDEAAGLVTLLVRDYGHWRQPRGQDRGRGLQLMEGLMDSVELTRTQEGTTICMSRRLRGREADHQVAKSTRVPT